MDAMNNLTSYLKKCINPKGSDEFIETEEFDIESFNALQQDGFYICGNVRDLRESLDGLENSEYVFMGDKCIIKKTVRSLDWLNEKTNKITFNNSRQPIYRRIIPPPCETVDHVLIIKQFLISLKQQQGYCNYVEYGVRDGHSLIELSKIADKSYGVDIVKHNKLRVPSNSEFYKMSTDQFSSTKLSEIKFNAVFIDADHSFTSAYRDFQNIFKHIQQNGYIFLHDTYPCNNMLLKKEFCNDCYKTPLQIKKDYNNSDQKDLEILTFPLNPGVTVVRKL